MQSKRLKALGDEYSANAEVLTSLIESNREKLNKAYRENRHNDELRYRRRQRELYEMRSEAVHTAALLKNYYRFSSVCTKEQH